MNGRATIVALAIFLLLNYSIQASSLSNPQSAAQPKLVVPSTQLSINQTVTGTLTYNAQQASYGIYLPVGQFNITLNVSSSANLGFEVTRWLLGIPTFVVVAVVSPPGVGRNSSSVLLLPTGPSPTSPGSYVIRIFPTSTSTLGSYWLRVQQIASFSSIQIDQQYNFPRWNNSRAVLYEVAIPQFNTYNVTLSTNNTVNFQVNTYEDDIFLPFSTLFTSSGRISFLAPLRSGEFYVEMIPGFASGLTLKGSISVNSTSTPTLTPGNMIQGTVSPGRDVYYYANMMPGYYYNLTLQVPAGQNLDLYAYSPTTANTPIAQSNLGSGLSERISNLVVFNGASYAINAAGEYQARGFQAMPDRVLISVRNVSVSSPSLLPFNLTLAQRPFPTLIPGATANVYLNSTAGPFYQFYTSSQTAPAVYNITYQFKVWGTSIWSNRLDLSAAEKSYKLATTPSTTIVPIENQHLFFTPQSFAYAAERWISEAMSNSTFNSNTLSRNSTTGVPVFAYMESRPLFIGAKLLSVGHSAYNGTLSYTETGAAALSIGTTQNDFLQRNQISLFTANLKAGRTYRINLQYTSLAVLSTIYSGTGYMQPTAPPLFSLIFPTDSSLPENGYSYLFTPTITTDYFIVDSGSFFLGGTPDGSYTLQIQEVVPPALSVTLNGPAFAEVGHSFNVTANVTNNGNFEAENVALSLSMPGALTTTPSPVATLGNLTPGASTQAIWTFNSTSPGNYTINAQTSSSNAPSVTSVTSILVTAPLLQVTISAPTSASPNTGFQVQVRVKNNGNVAAGTTTIQLLLPSGLSTSPSSQTISSISPGQIQTVTWTVNADASGDYTITATANEQYAGPATSTASLSVPPPWQYYLLAGVIGSLVGAFIFGVIFESRRKSRRGKGLPPPPAQK